MKNKTKQNTLKIIGNETHAGGSWISNAWEILLFSTETVIVKFEEMHCSVAQPQLGILKSSSSKSPQLSPERAGKWSSRK